MGIFGRALAGAGSAAADVANKYLDAQIQNQRAQVLADIQRNSAVQQEGQIAQQRMGRAPQEAAAQSIMDRARNSTALEGEVARATNQDITSGMAARESAIGRAHNDVALEGARAQATDQGITSGMVERETATAKAKADVARDEAKASASDPLYLRAVTAIKLADPQVAASIAASKASANASNAQAGYTNVHADSLRMDVGDKKRLDALYDQASSLLSDTKLSDSERATKMDGVNKQIALIKSKNGTAATRDKSNEIEEKMVADATKAALDSGTIKPEEAGGFQDKIRRSFSVVRVQNQMAPVVTQARKDGDMNGLIAELIGQGQSPEQMRAYGITDQELKAAQSKPKEAAAKQSAPVQSAGPADELRAANRELLKWGSVQRQRDPAGYQAAVQRKQSAEQALANQPNEPIPDYANKAYFGGARQ